MEKVASGSCCGNPSSCTKGAAPASGFDELLMKLQQNISEDPNVDIDKELVQRLLADYKSKEDDWEKFAFHHPDFYTRNLVSCGNGRYNLLVLCWPACSGSSIHSHSDSHCFVKMLSGTLKETIYEWPKSESCDSGAMVTCGEPRNYNRDGVTYINDSMGLHKMQNPSCDKPTVSLHLYTPPFATCKVFNETTSCQDMANVTFYSEYGKKVGNEMKANQLGTAEGQE